MNILITRFSSFGDVIISTAFVEAVRLKYPESKIYFLTKAGYDDVFKNNKNIEKVFTYNQNFHEMLTKLKTVKFDFMFDLSCNLRSFWLSVFLIFRGAKVFRIGKDILNRRMLVFFKKNPKKYIPIRQKYSQFFLSGKNFETNIFLDVLETNEAKELIKYNPDEFYIGINTGAKWDTKKWINSKYVKLINELLILEKNVVLIGDKNDVFFNAEITEMIERISPQNSKKIKFFNLTDKLNKRQLFSVISLMDCLLTTDSACLHIAQAVKVPVVALFGPTIKGFGFWDEKSYGNKKDCLVEVDLPCRPCSLHGGNICPQRHFSCMKDIKTEEVLESIKRFF
jgi:heptosyltransferase-2